MKNSVINTIEKSAPEIGTVTADVNCTVVCFDFTIVVVDFSGFHASLPILLLDFLRVEVVPRSENHIRCTSFETFNNNIKLVKYSVTHFNEIDI